MKTRSLWMAPVLCLLAAGTASASAFQVSGAGGSLGFGYQDYWLNSLRATAFQTRFQGDFSSYLYHPSIFGLAGALTLDRTNLWGKGWILGSEIFNIGYNLASTFTPRRKIPMSLFVSQVSSDIGPLTRPDYNSLVTHFGGTAFFPLSNIIGRKKNLPSFGVRLEEIKERVQGSLRPGRSHDDRATLTFNQGFKRTRYSGRVEANEFTNDVDHSGWKRLFLFFEDSSTLSRNTQMYVNGRAEDRAYKAAGGGIASTTRIYGSFLNVNYSPRPEYNGNFSYGVSSGRIGDSRSLSHSFGSGINLIHLPELTSNHNVYYTMSILDAGTVRSTSQNEGVGSQVSYNKGLRYFALQSFYRIGVQMGQVKPGQDSTGLSQGVGAQIARPLGRFYGFTGYEFDVTQDMEHAGDRTIGHTGNVGANGSLWGSTWMNSIFYIRRQESYLQGGVSGYDSYSAYVNIGAPVVGGTLSGGYLRYFPGGSYSGNVSASVYLRPPVRGLTLDIQTQFQFLPAFAYAPRVRLSALYMIRSILLKGSYEYNSAAFGVISSHVVFIEVVRNFRVWP